MLIKHTLTTQSPTHSHSHFTHTHYALSHIHSLHMHTHTHTHFICTHYSHNHFTHSLHTSIGNVLSITHHTRTHCRLTHYTHTLTTHSLTPCVCVCCVWRIPGIVPVSVLSVSMPIVHLVLKPSMYTRVMVTRSSLFTRKVFPTLYIHLYTSHKACSARNWWDITHQFFLPLWQLQLLQSYSYYKATTTTKLQLLQSYNYYKAITTTKL